MIQEQEAQDHLEAITQLRIYKDTKINLLEAELKHVKPDE